jgi:hypothetical protein
VKEIILLQGGVFFVPVSVGAVKDNLWLMKEAISSRNPFIS